MILLAWLLGLALQQEQPEKVYRFEFNVHTVYVDVFISKNGQPVTDLEAAEFVVLDNGIPQQVDIVDPQTVHWSVLLLLDTSASVTGEKLEHLRTAAHSFVNGLSIDDEAGLMTFAQVWELREGLSRDIAALHRSLDQPVKGGFTALNDALYAGLKLLEEGTGRPMVLLFTDGADNASWLNAKELLELVRVSEAVVHVVGIKTEERSTRRETDETNAKRNPGSRSEARRIRASDYLEDLADSTGGRAWYADSSADLGDVFLQVLRDMESRYLLSYQVEGAPQGGWHSIEVKLKTQKDAEIRSRAGYTLNR
jgi:VWFA-related protein